MAQPGNRSLPQRDGDDSPREAVSACVDEMGLQQQVDELRCMLTELSAKSENQRITNTAQSTLSDALRRIVEQLAPLQELAPRRTQMEEKNLKRLDQLRNSLQRPEWSGAGSLTVQEPDISFDRQATNRSLTPAQNP